ncbi:hypothetical protein FO488_15880 [Geobacter sp. FeAm09]|uniref:hypothetical protein n=1 Tax=Geobacter sp. FeAm09 TaxID=2597769 RepID=UPI0011EC7C92|nr:hypothetical protein [Geobacter sp. FeAm09]QEM69487.1 hypothetical protein FO488_15880 [Geobacter sp. FeAm09]
MRRFVGGEAYRYHKRGVIITPQPLPVQIGFSILKKKKEDDHKLNDRDIDTPNIDTNIDTPNIDTPDARLRREQRERLAELVEIANHPRTSDNPKLAVMAKTIELVMSGEAAGVREAAALLGYSEQRLGQILRQAGEICTTYMGYP